MGEHMRTIPILISILILTAALPAATLAHGTCSHETVHQYNVPVAGGPTMVSANAGAVTVQDSETGDCDGDGVAGDFDGDLDLGTTGGAFGHGPWAEWCGYHQEAAGTVTVSDFVFGSTVGFSTGSADANSWVADPVTGENTCLTDGVISPATDLEGDDCLSGYGYGTQLVPCPGGGDGLLWVFLLWFRFNWWLFPGEPVPEMGCKWTFPYDVWCTGPSTLGIITSP